MKSNAGFLINATDRTISKVSVSDGEIRKLIGCDLFCVGGYLEDGDTLYVDDEGLINGTEKAFFFDGRLLMGNGLVLGCDEDTGESRSAVISPENLAARVKFPPPCFRLDPVVRDEMCKFTV
jgi:hypothetical protein